MRKTVLFVLLCWFAATISAQDRWPIEWIELEGDFERVTAEQVRTAVMPHVTGGFFSVSVDEVVQAVADINWVSAAAARKVWPDRIVVRVVEHQPVARWNDVALISSTGQVFEVPEAPLIRGLPMLSGADQSAPKVVDFLNRSNTVLSQTGLSVVALALSERGAWTATLSGDIQVQLGREDPLGRIEKFAAAYQSSLRADERRIVSVDLRYPNGMAVQWGSDPAALLAGSEAQR